MRCLLQTMGHIFLRFVKSGLIWGCCFKSADKIACLSFSTIQVLALSHRVLEHTALQLTLILERGLLP